MNELRYTAVNIKVNIHLPQLLNVAARHGYYMYNLIVNK